MSSFKRIVLVEPSGEIVFEGVSVLGPAPASAPEQPAADVDDDPDACPPTMRSAQDSGFFAVAPRSKGHRAA